MIAPLATNAHAVFVPPPSIPRIFSSSISYVAAVYDRRPKCRRKFIGGHRPPLQSSRAKSRGIPLRKLASSHRHPPEASEGLHLFGGDHTKYIGIFATLSEVPQSERDWRCLCGSGCRSTK